MADYARNGLIGSVLPSEASGNLKRIKRKEEFLKGQIAIQDNGHIILDRAGKESF